MIELRREGNRRWIRVSNAFFVFLVSAFFSSLWYYQLRPKREQEKTPRKSYLLITKSPGPIGDYQIRFFFTRTRPGFISLLLACIAMMHALTFFLSFFSRAIFLKENQMWPRAHAFLLYSRKTSILTQFLLVFLNIF
jgi:hypothetical protein